MTGFSHKKFHISFIDFFTLKMYILICFLVFLFLISLLGFIFYLNPIDPETTGPLKNKRLLLKNEIKILSSKTFF